jgi:VWFA-related protein
MLQKFHQIFNNALFGGIGGLLGGFLIYIAAVTDPILIRDAIGGAIIGASIGLLTGIGEGIFQVRLLTSISRSLHGTIAGALGGLAGVLGGEIVMDFFRGGLLGRSLGWMCIGFGIGALQQSVANRSVVRFVYGAIGGTVGGYLSGGLFEYWYARTGYTSLDSQAVALMLLGASIGAIAEILDYLVQLLKKRLSKLSFSVKASPAQPVVPPISRPPFVGIRPKILVGIDRQLTQPKKVYGLAKPLQKPKTDLGLVKRYFTFDFRRKTDKAAQDKRTDLTSRFILITMLSILTVANLFAQEAQVQIQPQQATPQAVFNVQTHVDKSSFEKIMLMVHVTDENGKTVKGLEQACFQITEDNIPVLIEHFTSGPTDEPLAIALVIDKSGSMTGGRLAAACEAAKSFTQLTNLTDPLALITFSNRAQKETDLTTVKNEILQKIDQIQAGGGTNYYDAIDEGIKTLIGHPNRCAVVVLTDGEVGYDSTSIARITQLAKSNEITVFTVGLSVSGAALSEVAHGTGGRYYHAPTEDDLKELYESLYQELRYGYGILYTSPRPIKDGTHRKLQVSVKQNGKETDGYYIEGVVVARSGLALFIALLVPMVAVLGLSLGFIWIKSRGKSK